MALYPDSPRPNTGYAFRSNHPVVTGGPEWAPQSRPLTRFGLVEADMNYRAKSWAQIKTLYDFFESVDGSAGRFTFVDFNGAGPVGGTDPGVAWSALYVAKGDALTLAWDLPTFGLRASPAPVVYENGSVKTNDIYTSTWDDTKAYHIKVGAGTDGVDLLTAESAITTVATAPSPATTGTSLVVAAGKGARFPGTPFYANVWPTAVAPTLLNIETVQVTTVSTDTLTIVRHQNGTSARSIVVGDQIAVPPLSTVIITIDATCRRAMRRAKFVNVKNPFLLDVPALYSAGPVNVVEVRK
jgi:hypothetical protein